MKIKSRIWWLAGIILLSVATTAIGYATTSISRDYSTTDNLALGAIVSLKEDVSDEVVGATTDNVHNIFGVTVNDGSSPISISSGKENHIKVATDGIVPVLVSDINGEISQGDHITASPIKGVGMKATSNTRVIGIAQGAPRHDANSEQRFKDQDGKEQTVRLGQVPVLINVSYFFSTPEQTVIPAAFQNIANALAGKPVDPLPIIVSAAIFIIMLIVVASIIYSMIKSSIISVGRNPMSQSAVYRDVIQLSALVLGILAGGVIAIYLVLTRL